MVPDTGLHALMGILGFPGGPEVLVILIIGLLLFGGRLPEVGRSIGKSLVEFRKGLRGLKDEVGLGREMSDIRRDFEDAARVDDVVNDWPSASSDPWADLDKQEREARKKEAFGDVVDTQTVDAPDADAPTPDAPEADTPKGDSKPDRDGEARGPVARGEL